MSRRRLFLVSLPMVASVVLAAWLFSGSPSSVFRILYSEDEVGKWGVVYQENGVRFLCIGSSEERLPYDGEHYVVCTRTRCPFAVVRSFVAQEDFPVVVQFGKKQEPAFAYRVSDGSIAWQSR